MALNIKSKILMVLLVGWAAVIIAGALGLYGMKGSNDEIKMLYNENMTNVLRLNRIGELMRESRVHTLLALQHNPENEAIVKLHDHALTRHTDTVLKNHDEVNKLWTEYTSGQLSARERKMADEMSAKRTALYNEGTKPTLDALAAGNYEDAARLIVTKCNPLFKAFEETAHTLFENERSEAEKGYRAALEHFRTTLILVIVAVVAAIVVSGIVALMIIRSISSASSALIRTTGAMAQGDLSQRARITSQDEFGTIGTAFDTMADAFSRLIATVAENSTRVATAASQVYATSQQMATGAEEVASQTGSVATAGEEMSATSGDIAQNCSMAADASQQASQRAEHGATVIENTVRIMNQIADRVKDTSQTVENLGSRSDQIGEIIGTIEDIADQTNLLALNAAIEAARAGEQGRGFAVVADEVRALAERTTRATREIGEMIKSIQSETRTAVVAMEEGVHKVEEGREESARSGQAIQNILHQISEVTMQINQIATAAEEQTATTAEISSNMLQITEVVQQTARGAHESAQAANQLNLVAEELQRLVGQFKLS